MTPRAGAGEKQRRRAPLLINVLCWRGCGRTIRVEPDRYSHGLVCGECWDE